MSPDSLVSDSQSEEPFDLTAWLRSEADSRPAGSAASYRKAVDALQAYINTADTPSDFPSDRTLADWLVHMHMRGLSVKTSILYLDLVSGLYTAAVKAGVAGATDVFRAFKARLKALGADGWAQPVDDTLFMRFAAMTKVAGQLRGDDSVALDLILGSMLTGVQPFGKVALARAGDPALDHEVWRDIEGRHAEWRRRYIFPLSQSERTPAQLGRETSALVSGLLASKGIRMAASPLETVAACWTYAALRCGAAGSDIVAVLGHAPKGWPVLSLCPPSELDPAQRRHLIDQVARVFTSNPRRWYAMKLRRRVDHDTLMRRFGELDGQVTVPETFYPCDEIYRLVGRKNARLVAVQRPVLRDVVFFKCRVTDIVPLFARIGDLAWCFTTGGRGRRGTYAALGEREFADFQRAIAHFTPDYEVGPVGSLPLRPGDRIVVVGGDMAGLSGEVLGPGAEPGVIYRVRLFGLQQDIEWRVPDARLLDRVDMTTAQS